MKVHELPLVPGNVPFGSLRHEEFKRSPPRVKEILAFGEKPEPEAETLEPTVPFAGVMTSVALAAPRWTPNGEAGVVRAPSAIDCPWKVSVSLFPGIGT
jgi:hypothetical protein